MIDAALIDKINNVLAEEFEVDIQKITPEAPLMDTLDLDSLDLVDMVVLIEHNFGFTVVAKDFIGIKSFNDFYHFINNRINEKGAPK
ncbi:MAG: acyl carrier protein [Bacteroidetes bacterium HGW-Bacteroidetes-14]|jgi:acyl carrier protein|nr:MAG: acyl carrier protein [Bacteroidetes bacterium HGW-Bacteroidetes-14]